MGIHSDNFTEAVYVYFVYTKDGVTNTYDMRCTLELYAPGDVKRTALPFFLWQILGHLPVSLEK